MKPPDWPLPPPPRVQSKRAQNDLLVRPPPTPDNTFPATATRVQSRLGMTGRRFDVQAVCSGFIYAGARQFHQAEQARTAVVIGAETFSHSGPRAPVLNWRWRRRWCCVVRGKKGNQDRGILSTHLAPMIIRPALWTAGPLVHFQTVGHLRMEARSSWHGDQSDPGGEALQANDLSAADIDWVVPSGQPPHPGKHRRSWASMDRMVVTVDRHANTSV